MGRKGGEKEGKEKEKGIFLVIVGFIVANLWFRLGQRRRREGFIWSCCQSARMSKHSLVRNERFI